VVIDNIHFGRSTDAVLPVLDGQTKDSAINGDGTHPNNSIAYAVNDGLFHVLALSRCVKPRGQGDHPLIQIQILVIDSRGDQYKIAVAGSVDTSLYCRLIFGNPNDVLFIVFAIASSAALAGIECVHHSEKIQDFYYPPQHMQDSITQPHLPNNFGLRNEVHCLQAVRHNGWRDGELF
jgi:hypothetical protein